MRKWVVALTALLVAAALPAAAAEEAAAGQAAATSQAEGKTAVSEEITEKIAPCKYPDPPQVPDGTTASESEMGQAGAAVREFVAGIQSSLQCLSEVEKALGDDITDEQEATIVTVYNNGVDQMNAIADKYNQQVRAYKAR